MPKARTALELYQALKAHIRADQHAEARRLIRGSKDRMKVIWKELLGLVIKKHNCPVTTLLLKEFGKFIDRSEIVEFLAELDPQVEQDFAFKLRVIKFTENVEEFHEAFEKYRKTRQAYHTICENNFGKKIKRKSFP